MSAPLAVSPQRAERVFFPWREIVGLKTAYEIAAGLFLISLTWAYKESVDSDDVFVSSMDFFHSGNLHYQTSIL